MIKRVLEKLGGSKLTIRNVLVHDGESSKLSDRKVINPCKNHKASKQNWNCGTRIALGTFGKRGRLSSKT